MDTLDHGTGRNGQVIEIPEPHTVPEARHIKLTTKDFERIAKKLGRDDMLMLVVLVISLFTLAISLATLLKR